MRTLLDRCATLAARTLQCGSEWIVYSAGGQSVNLRAFPHDPEYIEAGDMPRLETDDLDWAFEAGDLILGGIVAEPASGARIARANGDVYEVRPLRGKQCWEPVDAGGRLIIVQTKKVT